MSNADWWAKKLGNTAPVPQGRPADMPPMPPSQQPMAPMPTFQQPQTSKAQSANLSATCPDCGSGNYFSATPQTSQRCYDCGYPIQQSGSRFGGLAGAHTEGAAKPAAGNDAQSNWNPQGIIGRIDG
jgi:ribosomal protein S27E